MSGLTLTMGKLHKLRGGLELRPWKQLSTQGQIRRAPTADQYCLRLRQHPGPPATPVVDVGDSVRRWQEIATSNHSLSASVHAPVSGEVATVSASEIVIRRQDDHQDALALPILDPLTASDKALRDRAHDAGLVGLGGASFPTDTKLRDPRQIKMLVINGTECEPYITSDEMLLRHRSESVLSGSVALGRAVNAEQIVVAIESRLPDLIEELRRLVADADNIEIVGVPQRFPEGGERQLTQLLFGTEVPSGGHPPDIGVLCHNVATAYALHEACVLGKPLVSRIVSITGRGVREPRVFEAEIGLPIQVLIEACGGYTPDVARLIAGGPMTGTAIEDDAQPIEKGSNCVLALIDRDVETTASTLPCIRCGECARVCPAGLLPQLLHWQLEAGDLTAAKNLKLADCILCGCCAQVCPSHIPLVDAYRKGKWALMENAQREQDATTAERRHRIRSARLTRAENNESEQRQELERDLEAHDAQSLIAAMVERARGKS